MIYITELKEDINMPGEWANKCQMNFNVDECSVMHIGNDSMSNLQVLKTDQQGNLGIVITKNLNGRNKQPEKSYKTANKVLGFIDRNFKYKNKEVFSLYKSFVRPHLEYAARAVQFSQSLYTN